MLRNLAVALCALIFASAASGQTRQSAAEGQPPALRLMNDTQFSSYLRTLDADVVNWRAHLKSIRIASLGLAPAEQKELERSYNQCLESLDYTLQDIHKLSQKQVLKGDFLLLMDLSGLARSLDQLSNNLANADTLQGTPAALKSVGWARDVLTVDQALAMRVVEFQRHLLAYAGLADVALESGNQNAAQNQERR